MSTAISSAPEAAHPSPSRAPSYGAPSRSQSTRLRPPTSSAPVTAGNGTPPHRAASHHQSSNRQPSTSAARPAQDILPHEEYANETTNVASQHKSKRSSSKDRPPASSSQPHRRNSQRSNSSRTPGQPDMATAASNGAPAPVPHGVADARVAAAAGGGPKQGRSRTTIPTQSGKWILGKTIGAGSMGKVKLAKKEESNEQVRCLMPIICSWMMAFSDIGTS